MRRTLSRVVTQVVSVIIWVVAFVMILNVLGVPITPLLASIGVAPKKNRFVIRSVEQQRQPLEVTNTQKVQHFIEV